MDKYNHKDIALAAYQAGETVVNNAIKKAGKTRDTAKWEDVREYLPVETRNYPEKVNKNLRNILSI